MIFTTRQLNTVLAALRLWQDTPSVSSDLLDIATDHGKADDLDSAEIDELCEALNFEECEDEEDEPQELNEPMPLSGQPGGPPLTMLVFPRPGAPACLVSFARYQADQTIAIQLKIVTDGEAWGTATVCLYPPCEHPGEHGVWLKGWSENEGLPEALEKAGVLKLTGKTSPTGYCEAQHAELTEAGIAELKKQEAANPARFGRAS
jgi:hypothetical protein